jgi:hypothetical protein
MVAFEISESTNFRGGNHFCYVFADNPNEVTEELKEAWYSSGIHKEGGELFLSALISDGSGKAISLVIGSCTFDSDNYLFSTFEFRKHDEYDWYALGFFMDRLDGCYLGRILEEFFKEDTPDRVLGSFLYRAIHAQKTKGLKSKSAFGSALLATILNFSKQHGKAEAMLQWLLSSQGTDYLQGNPVFSQSATQLLHALHESTVTDIDTYIKKYKQDLGCNLFLPSSLPELDI